MSLFPAISSLHVHQLFSSSSSSDRSGIENVASVEQLQENLIRALRSLVSKSPPGNSHHNVDSPRFTKLLLKLPDLRTLNNMHSEKLLSFRIDA